MKDDPILTEVRATRKRLFDQSGGTMDSFFDMLVKKEAKQRRRILRTLPGRHRARKENPARCISLKDPIVEEVRQAGRKLFEEAGGTLEGFCEMLRREEAKDKRPIFRRRTLPAPKKERK